MDYKTYKQCFSEAIHQALNKNLDAKDMHSIIAGRHPVPGRDNNENGKHGPDDIKEFLDAYAAKHGPFPDKQSAVGAIIKYAGHMAPSPLQLAGHPMTDDKWAEMLLDRTK